MKIRHFGERYRGGLSTVFVGVLVLLLPSSTSTAIAQPAADMAARVQRLLEDMRSKDQASAGPQKAASPKGPRAAVGKDGYLIHIGAPADHYFPVTRVVAGNPRETALNFLEENRDLFGAVSPAVGFRSRKGKQKNGRHYVSFEQTYDGIPFFASGTLVQLNDSGGVEYVLSDISRDTHVLDDGTLSLVADLSARRAEREVESLFATEFRNQVIETTAPELMLYDPSIVGNSGHLQLVWVMEVYTKPERSLHEKILIDAHTGEVALRYSLIMTALQRDVYDQANTRTTPTNPVRSDVQNPPGPGPSGFQEADDAWDYIAHSYDFYWTEHGRDGRDGEGGLIEATVRWCSPDPSQACPYGNAHGGAHMTFGEALATDDTVGHEYTHYITLLESALPYVNQSGAINEAFSDTWGEFIDLTNGAGTDTADARWKLFEDTATYGEDGALGNRIAESGTQCGNLVDDDGDSLADEGCPGSCHDSLDNGGDGTIDLVDVDCASRDMADPPTHVFVYGVLQFPHPDRLSALHTRDDLYVEEDIWDGLGDDDGICDHDEDCTTLDNGGVHLNSGIGNKLAYLLTDGDGFNGWTVQGMGIPVVADLFYEVQTGTLYDSGGASYIDFYFALRQAAVNLEWTPLMEDNLYRACRAVEIASGGASDHYVSLSGSDTTGDGSMGNPYRTVGKGQAAADAGDRVMVEGGSYDETPLLNRTITISPHGGTVIIGQ